MYIVKLDPQGKHVWSRTFGDADEDEVRGLALDAAGTAGNHIWSHSYGGPSGDMADAVVIDEEGNVAAMGSFGKNARFGGDPLACAGGSDAFLMLLAPDGTPRWTRTWGGAQNESGEAVGVDAAGALTVTGHFERAVDFGAGVARSAGNQDVFLVRVPPP